MASRRFPLPVFLACLLSFCMPFMTQAEDLNGDGYNDGGAFIDLNNDGRSDSDVLDAGLGIQSGDGRDEGLPFIDLDNDGRNDANRADPLREDQNHVLIVSDSNPRAFFGYYRATQMPATGWNLLRRTIDWADGGTAPPATNVLLFTYNNDLIPPVDPQQADGFEVYQWLVAQGYNITGHHQSDMASLTVAYFQTFDLILYWNGYGYDPSNAIASGTPFITVSTQHTAAMNLGGGGTLHQSRQDFCVINNGWYPTGTYPLGPLTLESSMWTDGIQVGGEGVALIADVCMIAPAAQNHVLIVSDTNPRAFFGFYRATMMPATGWDLLRRTIDWADGGTAPPATDLLLFTYNNDLIPPVDPQQADGFEVYQWLVARGYNVTGHHQSEMASLSLAYFQSFDVILYWNGYGYDPTTAIASGTPLITVSTQHTTAMNIGSGGTLHQNRADFCVISNAYYPTAPYPVGPLTLESSMWTDGVRVLGEGVVLIGDDCLAGDVDDVDVARRLHLLGGPDPNPVLQGMAYSLTLQEPSWVQVGVFDVTGKLIRTLVDAQLPAGTHSFRWDPARGEERTASSGVYYLRARTKDSIDSRKFLIMR